MQSRYIFDGRIRRESGPVYVDLVKASMHKDVKNMAV